MNVGLYFGSFNPIHTGHLIIASHILNETKLSKIWFVVSPQNPFKPATTLLNEYDRLYLVQKAIEGNNQLHASSIEFSLPKPSYTSHTLAYLKEKYPTYQFTLIMGSDSFQNLDKWKNAAAIINHYPVLIYERPGFKPLHITGGNFTVLRAPMIEISASHIRELIQRGKSIQYLVPQKVEEEIIRNRFFKKKS